MATGTPSQMARALLNPAMLRQARVPAGPAPRSGGSGGGGTLAQMRRALDAPSGGGGGAGLPAYKPGAVGGGGKPKAPGLLEQAKRMALGMPAGIAKFIGQIGETAVSPVRYFADIARSGTAQPQSFAEGFEKYAPAAYTIGHGFTESVKDVADPRRFAEPGQLLPKLVNLGANVALVAAPLGAALGTAGVAGEAGLAGEAGALSASEAAARVAAGVAPETTAAVAGRGIAGALSRAGMAEEAAAVGRAGSIARQVASGGAQVGNAPALVFSKPAGWINRAVGAQVGERALPVLSEAQRAAIGAGVREAPVPRLSTLARNKLVGTLTEPGPLGRAIPRLIPEKAELAGMLGNEQVAMATAARNVQRQFGRAGEVTPEQQTAAVLIADQRIHAFNQTIDKLAPAELDQAVADVYRDTEPTLRPTAEQVRYAIKAQRRALPGDEQAGVDRFLESIRAVSGERTTAALAGVGRAGEGAVSVSQTGTELLPEYKQLERTGMEREREQVQRSLVREQAKYGKVATLADIRERTAAGAETGRPIINEIVRDAKGRPVLDEAGNVIPAMTETQRVTPEAPGVAVPRSGEIRNAVKETKQQAMYQVGGQIEDMIQGGVIDYTRGRINPDAAGMRPRLDDPEAANRLAAWASRIDKSERDMLRREGWVDSPTMIDRQTTTDPVTGKERTVTKRIRKPSNRLTDNTAWVEAWNRTHGTDFSLDEAIDQYLNAVHAFRAARSGFDRATLQQVGERFGLYPEEVAQIHNEGRVGTAAVGEGMRQELGRLRDDFKATSTDQQAYVRQLRDSMKEIGVPDEQYGELVGLFMPESYFGPEGVEGRMLGNVSMEDVVDYMLGDEKVIPGVPKMRAATPEELARINREVGTLMERARSRQRIVAPLQRRFDTINDQIANLDADLQTKVQDRIAGTNDRYLATAKRVARQLGPTGPAQAIDRIISDSRLTPGARFDVPNRVHAAFDEWRDTMSAEQMNRIDDSLGRWQKERANVTLNTFDRYMKAAPAPYRPALTTARDLVRSFIEKGDAATGDLRTHWYGLAEEVTTNLEGLVAEGVRPVHLTGGPLRRVPGLAGAVGTQPRKLAEQFARKEGYGPVAGEDVMRSEAGQAMTRSRNLAIDEIGKTFGAEAQTVIPDAATMEPAELAGMLDEAGFRPIRARRGGGALPTTTVVPKQIYDVLTKWDAQWADKLPGLKSLTSWTGMLKTNLLPLAPRWHIGNIVGNILMATVHGGIDPIRLATEMVRMRGEAKARGMTMAEYMEEFPAQLSNYGLTAGERESLYGPRGERAGKRERNPLAPVIKRSYAFNEFVDSYTRSAVYRAKLRAGVPSEAAMTATLKAMGDFTRLSPFERQVARQMMPFYPWLRHQTQAMMRLPVEHPMRAAWLGYLANLYVDPTLSSEERRLLGLRLPIPGLGDVNLGFMNPFPELPTTFGQIGQQIGQAINPIIKEPVAQATGFDINRLRQIPRPPGVEVKGAFGAEPTSILGSGLGASLYHAAGILPGTRVLRGLVADPGIQRYSTGEQVGKVPKPSNRGRLSLIAQGLGLPSWDEGVDPKRLAELRKAAGG